MTHYSIDFSNMAEFSALAHSVQAALNCKGCLISIVHEDALVALGRPPEVNTAANRAVSARDLICAHTVRQGAPVRVTDIAKDLALRNTPAVAALGIGAYVGVPLRLESGEVVGAMCGLSSEPRLWTQGEVEYMLAVADLAESKIERHILRFEQRALSAALAETDAILSVLAELRDRALTVQNTDGDLVFANLAVRSQLGLSYLDVMRLPPRVAAVLEEGHPEAEMTLTVPGRGAIRVLVRVSPVKSGLILADWTVFNS
ncbi:GAF domain-containing protein [Tateyamaria sp.]|uniref:GAF domain-containing protein n=1 Tax=Tateyamaria sp. TaxID=1929288 RepID=UPI003B214728